MNASGMSLRSQKHMFDIMEMKSWTEKPTAKQRPLKSA